MLLGGLHPLAGNGPDGLVHIDLAPAGLYDLAGPGCGQDQEFQRTSRVALLGPELLYECANLAIRQGGMVLDFVDFRALRQQILKMASPSRRIFASAVASGSSPVEDGLDPPAQPAGRLVLLRPDRLQRFHHHAHIDLLYRDRAEQWIRIGVDRALPLRRMLGITPAGAVGLDIRLGTVNERHGPRSL